MTLSAAIVAFVNATLGLITNFGVSLSDNQKGSIVVLVNAGLVLAALVYDRRTKRTMSGPPAGSSSPGP